MKEIERISLRYHEKIILMEEEDFLNTKNVKTHSKKRTGILNKHMKEFVLINTDEKTKQNKI